MKPFALDHDLHIHSFLSQCSSDPEQNPEFLLRYAREEGLKTLCLTDHFWDESVPGASQWYAGQGYSRISQALPLPRQDGVRFLFGCEAEMDRHFTLSVDKAHYGLFDFIVVSTTHFNRVGFTVSEESVSTPAARAQTWLARLERVLEEALPFQKVGIAHLTCKLIAPTPEEWAETLSLLPEGELMRLFTKAAKLGAAIELNSGAFGLPDWDSEVSLRPYRIAKACGCKFYCGSDAHHPQEARRAGGIFRKTVEALELTEGDKAAFLLRQPDSDPLTNGKNGITI